MSIQDLKNTQTIQNLLSDVSSQNPNIVSVAQSLKQYTDMVNAGSITAAEYLELVKDTQRKLNIQHDADEISEVLKVNSILNTIIAIYGVLP